MIVSSTQSLTKITGKDVKFVWSEAYENSFSKLKEAMTSAPILVLPQTDKLYVVYTDTSLTGIRCVLIQNNWVVAYASRQLKSMKETIQPMI